MKKFLIKILCSFGIPFITLLGIYIWTDPFRTLKAFSLHYYDSTNRDYISSELYLKNNPKLHYNSFIFGSSRAGGINSYKWKEYLSNDSRQFVFQGWSETITGIKQKLEYIDNHGDSIQNAMILIDIPGSFANQQEPDNVLSIKHYKFSGQPFLLFQAKLFAGFVKPTFIIKSIKNKNNDSFPYIGFDTISNDWYANNHNNYTECPKKDSLKNCTQRTKEVFLKTISKQDTTLISKPIIDNNKEKILRDIKFILTKQHTSYVIVITPGFYLTQPQINQTDLRKLQEIFGKDNVYDYSGQNYLSIDYNNFSDPSHFGLYVGWHILEDIYKK